MKAFRILTVLPLPGDGDVRVGEAAPFFPLVGACIGVASGTVFWIAAKFFGAAPAAVLAVACSILLTGALHEDGLADSADGLFGGRDREARLAIMKDSHIGTFGVLALLLSVAARIACLASGAGFFALVAAHAFGRFGCVVTMAVLPYAGDPSRSRFSGSADTIGARGVASAAIIAGLAMAPLGVAAFPALALAALAGGAVVGLAKNRIGGRTGDILGAVEQMIEIAVLLGATSANS